MGRKIDAHQLGGDNPNQLIEIAAGEPGAGGAAIQYTIAMTHPQGAITQMTLQFCANSRDGWLTNEALLAIVQDRLRGFQTGDGQNDCNMYAIGYIEDALYWLRKRVKYQQMQDEHSNSC